MTPEPYEEAYTRYIRRRHPLRALLADWGRRAGHRDDGSNGMRLRRVTGHDVPTTVGWSNGPRQIIFARTPEGGCYVDPDVPNTAAMSSAWLGLTTEPLPASLR